MREWIDDTSKRIADVIRATVDELEMLIGPLDDRERADLMTVLTFQTTRAISARMIRGVFISHGADGPEFACSDTDPTKMCVDCREGFAEFKKERGLTGE